jgi:hypothetical protein
LRDPPLQEFKPKTKCNGNGNGKGNGEERSFGRALRQEDQKRAKENSPAVLALFVGQVRAARGIWRKRAVSVGRGGFGLHESLARAIKEENSCRGRHFAKLFL